MKCSIRRRWTHTPRLYTSGLGMSLHGIAKLGRLVPRLVHAKPTQQLRAMSLAGLKNYDDREAWEENMFAKKASSPRLAGALEGWAGHWAGSRLKLDKVLVMMPPAHGAPMAF